MNQGVDYDLQGRLRVFTLSDIFQMLSFTARTGTLTLAQGWNTRDISFENGRICYIAAATRLPTLPEILLTAGKITAEQWEQALVRGESAALSFLLARNWVTEDDLKRCREQQLEQTIYTLFLWRNCLFTFVGGEVNHEGGVPVNLNTEHLIIEGTRRVDEWIEISPVVPSVLMSYRKVPHTRLEEGTDQHFALYQGIDGTRDVTALAKHGGFTEFDTARLLYELASKGVVEPVPPDRSKVVSLFSYAVESIYLKLGMYGFSRDALQFEKQLNEFAIAHGLKTRMQAGKIAISDLEARIDTTALLDLYKLFVGIENNKFAKTYSPEIARGLTEGLYLHLDAASRRLMSMYEFYQIEGLLPAFAAQPASA